MKYISRSMEHHFSDASKYFPVILLTGARQVGKTTMLRHLAANTDRSYASLDETQTRELARTDPQLFLQQFPPPVLIDEVQYAPELFEQIKVICDQRQEPGLFWLTGSEHYLMMRNVRESLVGRVALLQLTGLSQSEILGIADDGPTDFSLDNLKKRQSKRNPNNVRDVFDRIWRGGFPGMQELNPKLRKVFFDSYAGTYLARDAADYGHVESLENFQTFLVASAALIGQQVNLATLAKTVGIDQKTAKRWLQILEGLGIVYLLRPFSTNTLRRLAKTPKLYYCDTGLAAHLGSWPNSETLMNGASSGAFLENYIVMELVKSFNASQAYVDLSYYRDSSGCEIDVIAEIDGRIHPLEIKKSAMPRHQEIGKFQLIESEERKRGPGGIICMADKPFPITRKDNYIPVNLI